MFHGYQNIQQGAVKRVRFALGIFIVQANVSASDVLYDLGCGEGEFLIAAAKLRGCQGVGVDLDEGVLTRAETFWTFSNTPCDDFLKLNMYDFAKSSSLTACGRLSR